MDETPSDGSGREPGEAPSLEVVASNAHFMLTRDAGGYDVWTVNSDDEPLASYPADEQGADDAMAEFERLTRSERGRRLVPAILLTGLVVGAVAAVLGTAVQYTAYLLDSNGFTLFPENDPAWWVDIASVANVIGYQLGVACLALLVGVYLARRLRTPT